MADKSLAFHVGAHKTGTSLVQRFLSDHPETYADHGIEYVKRDDMSRYCSWGKALINQPEPFLERLDQFRAQPGAHTLFGSYENLLGHPFVGTASAVYPRAARNVAALARSCNGLPTRIFLSIRPPADFIESYYLHTVNTGASSDFRDWLRGVDIDRLSWRPVVDALLEHFGSESVEIVDFRLVHLGQVAYVSRFLRVIDPDFDSSVEYRRPLNRSLSEKGLRMALAANPLLKNAAERKAMRRFLQRHFSNIDQPRPALLTAGERDAIAERYQDEYEELTRLNSFDTGRIAQVSSSTS